MIEERSIKTHLIISDIHDEVRVSWTGSLGPNVLWKNNAPLFVLKSRTGRAELNTTDLACIEKVGKNLAEPKGREAITTATTYIYVKNIDNSETLVGRIVKRHVKTFSQMYDTIGWR